MINNMMQKILPYLNGVVMFVGRCDVHVGVWQIRSMYDTTNKDCMKVINI